MGMMERDFGVTFVDVTPDASADLCERIGINPQALVRAKEVEWLTSLLEHIEKGEIELVKESLTGAIEVLKR